MTMSEKIVSVDVNVNRLHGSWHIASSKNLQGFKMMWNVLPELLADIPAGLKTFYKALYGEEVSVREAPPLNNSEPFPLRFIVEQKPVEHRAGC
jgi:hypothetical protein